jgi:imidazolonepropionase
MIKIYKNLNQIITLNSAFEKDGRKVNSKDLSIVENGAIAFDKKNILWIGKTHNIPSEYENCETFDLTGHILTPEIVDSHTHLVFGGNRAFEYSLRLGGADYEEIANAGGGILSTMEKTIMASEDELYQTGLERVERIHSYGVGTIEIKSGYGLTMESERKICRVINKLKKHFHGKVQIKNTFLAAHAVPKSFESSKEYLDKIVIPLLKELHSDNLIDFVDIFHEKGYFNESDTRTLFDLAKELGLPVKIHADEFNDNKGAVIASEYNALSADHLLCTTSDGIAALANSQTVATLLPGTAHFLGKPLANARAILDAGAKMALASDYNPGSCHCDNVLLIASISAKSLEMNLAEIWCALTLNSAHALGLRNQGALTTEHLPRFSLFKCSSIDEITYSWGRNFSTKLP